MSTFDELINSRRNDQDPDSHDPNNVMSRRCSSCPFNKLSGGIGSEYGESIQAHLQTALIKSALTEANRLCHHPGLSGKPETKICRGARDI